tara:strand:+ start:165 stop:392 length:228 start_codon:yes stop_codon:yes gene_type:complete
MPKKERKVIVNCSFAVVKIGVTDTACLNVDYDFAGSGIGNLNVFDRYRSTFGSSYDAAYLVWHRCTPSVEQFDKR